MKKIFIIFLTFVLILGILNFAIAEEKVDFVSKIEQELDNIENCIVQNQYNEVEEYFDKVREYVYSWASELVRQKLFDNKVLEIINLVSDGIEKKDVQYISKARDILKGFKTVVPVVINDKHS